VRNQDHAAASATIAPGRASEWNVFLAAESDASVSTIARGDFESHFVDEVHARPYVG